MEESGELCVPALPRVEPDSVRDLEDEGHDVTAVTAGVSIVCFDDVSEEHGGAAVRVAELECVIDPNLALTREVGEQPDQGQRENDQRRVRTAADRREERDRREGQVDRPDPDHEADQAQR